MAQEDQSKEGWLRALGLNLRSRVSPWPLGLGWQAQPTCVGPDVFLQVP